jgi:hypothetical protein
VRLRIVLLAQAPLGIAAAGVEVAQRDAAEAAALVQPAQDLLHHGFRFAVRADRSEGRIFEDGDTLGRAVDRGAGGEHQPRDAGPLHGRDERERSADVVDEVQLGLLDRLADRDESREVDHRLDTLAPHQYTERVRRGHIHHAQARWFNVVAVAPGEVIDHHRVEARADERLNGVRTDVAGAAGHQDLGHFVFDFSPSSRSMVRRNSAP